MTRRLAPLGIVLTLLLGGVLRGEEWGDLTARFVYDGEPPARKLFPLSRDAVCLTEPVFDQSLIVGETRGIANIVVYVFVKEGDDPPPVHRSYAEHAEDEVVLLERNCRFEPRMVLMRTSQTLLSRNLDDLGHLPKINGFRNEQVACVVPSRDEATCEFPLEEPVPLPVTCSIHPWMKAWLLVRDSPYFAVTDERGRFTIRNLPSGEWTFQFWHEQAGYLRQVTIDGTERQWTRGRVRLAIEPGENDLGTIRLTPETFE